MYSRHKPGIDWRIGDDFPDFGKIKVDQSFNWSAFSIPVWARYTDLKEYKSEYGILGICVRSIRKTHEINTIFDNNSWIVRHDPKQFNYSHCELHLLIELNRCQRRQLRMTLKHKATCLLSPQKEYKLRYLMGDYLIMLYHRLIFKFFNF